MTSCCLLATPCEGTIFADIGEYTGPLDVEAMINNVDFVDWDGKVARYFVPVEYYVQFQPQDGKGPELYQQAFGGFSHFAFFEYQECDEWCEIWVDKDNCLNGEWLLLMFKEGVFHWFNNEVDAQTIFIWLTSPDIQGLIYEQHKLTGSNFPLAVASKIN